MSETSAAAELEQPRETIRYHLHLYHVLDDPEISDVEYDELFRRLETLEAEHPDLVTPDSPTREVGGAPVSAFAPVTHRQPPRPEQVTMPVACEPQLDGDELGRIHQHRVHPTNLARTASQSPSRRQARGCRSSSASRAA